MVHGGSRSRVAAALGSRWNLVGTSGAIAGVVTHLAGVVGPEWPLLSLGCYGLGASLAVLTRPRTPDPAARQLAELGAILDRCRAAADSLTEEVATELRAVLDAAEDVAALSDGEIPDAYLRRDEVLALLGEVAGGLERYLAVDQPHREEADALLVAMLGARLAGIRRLRRDTTSGIDELRAYVRALP